MRRAILALGATAALLAATRPLEPFQWGHRLDGACQWSEGRYAAALGSDSLDERARAAEWACWRSHGAHGLGLDVVQIVQKWPDAATLATWQEGRP